jgi:hypothetical protein
MVRQSKNNRCAVISNVARPHGPCVSNAARRKRPSLVCSLMMYLIQHIVQPTYSTYLVLCTQESWHCRIVTHVGFAIVQLSSSLVLLLLPLFCCRQRPLEVLLSLLAEESDPQLPPWYTCIDTLAQHLNTTPSR